MPKTEIDFADIENSVGLESEWTDWVEVKQEKINLFADATGDHQWIHVDIEKAKKGPFGGPIAHGYYSVSILAAPEFACFSMKGVKMGVNYGLNKVRFPAPVPVGKRIHAKATVKSVTAITTPMPGFQIEQVVELWVEGNKKPSMVAETLSRLFG